MSAYIVRVAGTHELVGFVIADTNTELFWAADEVTNPHCCEYKRITGGGILWHKNGDVYSTFPDEDGTGFATLPLDGASLASRTMMQYEDKRPWKRFEADAGYSGEDA